MMQDELGITSFRAYGLPIPQAGTRIVQTAAGPRGITAGSKALRPWRDVIAVEAEVCRVEGKRHTGPVRLDVEFRFPMPASRPARLRRQGSIPKTVQPDLDKLIRAVCDSLTVGGLLLDDAQVCEIHASKAEWVDSWTGADVTVRDLWIP
jgi:Holliday junction resolvase RusA-like endonuclease